jgi:2-(1,2-epoxy-1,2-dihydrophenyl)acetyl-CoA isomerase
MIMGYQTILLRKEDNVATIILNRPEKLNAVIPQMVEELIEATLSVGRDDAIKVVILTGAGRAFSAGGDTSAHLTFQSEDPKQLMEYFRELGEVILNLRSTAKPTLAVVNGPAIGAGFSLALGCDIVLASEGANFSVGFIRMALHPEGGITYILPRVLGTARACELIFTGKTIDAKEAERIGLVNQVVPREQLEIRAKDLANTLARAPAMALGLSKISLYQALDINLASAIEREARAQTICMSGDDVKEAVNAFLEKRPPNFSRG